MARRQWILFCSTKTSPLGEWFVSKKGSDPLYKLQRLEHYVGAYPTYEEAVAVALSHIDRKRRTLLDQRERLQKKLTKTQARLVAKHVNQNKWRFR